MQENYYIFVDLAELFYKAKLALGHTHMLSVVALRLKSIGQTSKNHHLIGVFRSFESLVFQRFVSLIAHIKAARISNARYVGRRLHGGYGFVRIYMRASAALIAGLFGERAHESDLFALFQRKYIAVIFQQYRAVFGDLCGKFVVAVFIPYHLRFFLAAALNQLQHAAHAIIQLFLAKLAALHRLNYRGVVLAHACGHFEVKPRADSLCAVVNCAPVAHHKSAETPVVAKNIRKQQLVLRGILSVYLVVRAHNRPRLSVFHHRFKSGEVDLVQSSLVDICGNAHAAALLIISGEMLQRSANAHALHARYMRLSHLRSEVGVFREVLKISAA